MKQEVRTDHAPGGRALARDLNLLGHGFNRIRGENGIHVRRDEQGAPVVGLLRPFVAPPLVISYRVWISGGHVWRGPGRRRVIGSDWTADASAQDMGAVTTNAVVYIVWTYTTATVAGAWGSWSYGTPPVEDASKRVFELAATPATGLILRRLGDLEVFDIRYRQDCS
jgi:hypothetical protein